MERKSDVIAKVGFKVHVICRKRFMTVNMIKLVKVNVYQLALLVLVLTMNRIAYFVIMLFSLQLQSNQKHRMECASEHSTSLKKYKSCL